jgi:hypothetical protein
MKGRMSRHTNRQMSRRRFLVGSTAALGLAGAPGFIRNAFGDTSARPPKKPPAPVELDAARGYARELGRALLVLVVPKIAAADGLGSVDERSLRGQAWGSFLLHAPVDDFLLLAPFEVVCAPMAEIARHAPGIAGEPWAVLLDPTRPPVVVDGKIPELAHPSHPHDFTEVDKSIDRQIAALGAALRQALPAEAKRPVPPKERKAAELALARRLRDDAPPGSRWDKVWDCPPCGMAQTPAKSARFLTFFVKGEPPPAKPPHSD